MKFRLLVDQDFLQKSSSEVKHLFPVGQGKAKPSYAHDGLRFKFLRMLRLGGDTTAAIEYAKQWRCPVYARAKPTQRPSRTTTWTRPYTSNRKVCVDLKYLVDAEDNKHVALSAVGAGTLYHVACLVKNMVPKARDASLRGNAADSLRRSRDCDGGPRR